MCASDLLQLAIKHPQTQQLFVLFIIKVITCFNFLIVTCENNHFCNV